MSNKRSSYDKGKQRAAHGENSQPRRAGNPGKQFGKSAKRVHPKNHPVTGGLVRGGIRL